MSHDRSPDDFIFQVDIESATISNGEQELGDVVGV
jgi:hypothetical protein